MSLPSARSKSSLCDLPDETILKITSYLIHHPRSLVSLSSINKRLHRILDADFWIKYQERRFAFIPRNPTSDFPSHFLAVLNRIKTQPQKGKAGILDIIRVSCLECEAFNHCTAYHFLAKRLLCNLCMLSEEYQLVKKTEVKEVYGLNDNDIAHLPMQKRANVAHHFWKPAQLYQRGPIERLSNAEKAEKAAVQEKQKAKKEGAVSKRMDLLRKHLKKQDVTVGDFGFDTQQAIDDWAQTGRPGVKAFVESLMSQHESAKGSVAIEAQASERLDFRSVRPNKRRKV